MQGANFNGTPVEYIKMSKSHTNLKNMILS